MLYIRDAQFLMRFFGWSSWVLRSIRSNAIWGMLVLIKLV